MLVNKIENWLDTFYKRKLREDIDASFKVEKSFFFWRNKYERSPGVVCPIDYFYTKFSNLQSASELVKKIRLPNVDKTFNYIIDEDFYKKLFNNWYPDYTNQVYKVQMSFPLIVIYNTKVEKIQFLFKSHCFRIFHLGGFSEELFTFSTKN
jgi:hypothetical protein